MPARLIVLLLCASLAPLPQYCDCQAADKPAAARPEPNPAQAQAKEGQGAVPVAADTAAEAQRILAQLRGKLPEKTDDEIIQVLRGYTSAAPSADGGGMKWLAERLEQARKQKETIAKLHIYCKYAESGKVPPAPPWLSDLLGKDFFGAVDTVDVGEGSLSDAQLAQLSAFPQLRMLRLSGCFPKNTDAGLEHLAGLNQLQELSLARERSITDAGLAHLQGLRSLRSLNLAYTPVTDAGLQHLEKLIHLESLNVADTRVTDAGLRHVEKLVRLQSLDVSRTKVTDAGIERLAGLPELASLDIRGTQATEAVLARLKDWPKLRHVRHGFALGDQGLALLAGFPQLRNPDSGGTSESVSVHLRGVSDEGMARIETIGKPMWLQIERARITTGWSHLDRMPSVTGLTIKDTVINREGMAAIARLPKLDSFSLDGAQITGGWEHLTQIKRLDPIASTATAWPPEGLAASSRRGWVNGGIAKSEGMTLGMIGRSCGPRARELFLFPDEVGLNLMDCPQYPQYMSFVIGCRVRGPDLAALADFADVRILEIDDESLAVAALPYIPAMPQLKELRLCCPMTYPLHAIRTYRDPAETPIERPSRAILFEALRNPTSLKTLKGLAIHVPSDEHLAFLAKLPQLESLRLYGDHNITDAGLERLTGLSNLRHLCLTGTKVGDAGLERLKGLTRLQSLDLDDTQVTDAGLEYLRTMSGLKWLNLNGTQTTGEGVKKLKQVLPNCDVWSAR